jgi:hypothetical protein
LTWTPRSLDRRNNFGNNWNNFGGNNNIDQVLALEQFQILELEGQVLAEAVLEEEILFVEAIQEQVLLNKEFIAAQDNIRINTFNNINNNVVCILSLPSTQRPKANHLKNTVIIIVTTIVDNRDKSNKNNRYMVRQRQSNSEIQEQVFVVIEEASTVTINNEIPSNVISAAQSTGTGFASFAPPSVGSYTPGQAATAQSGINILPLGMGVPTFSNSQSYPDPAIIILENQQAFVTIGSNTNSFVDTQLITIAESGGSASIVEISTSS